MSSSCCSTDLCRPLAHYGPWASASGCSAEGALAAAGVEVDHVPGYHETMVAEPNAPELARFLRACLRPPKTGTSCRVLCAHAPEAGGAHRAAAELKRGLTIRPYASVADGGAVRNASGDANGSVGIRTNLGLHRPGDQAKI